MFYSPSANGFYCREVHGDNMPIDAVAIDGATYIRFSGKPALPGADGLPSEPAPVQPAAPSSVTMRQARLALLAAEKLGMVEAAISSLPSPQREAAQIEWEFAATVDRKSATTALLAAALGMSSEELDQLFTLAATL